MIKYSGCFFIRGTKPLCPYWALRFPLGRYQPPLFWSHHFPSKYVRQSHFTRYPCKKNILGDTKLSASLVLFHVFRCCSKKDLVLGYSLFAYFFCFSSSEESELVLIWGFKFLSSIATISTMNRSIRTNQGANVISLKSFVGLHLSLSSSASFIQH